MSDPKFHTQEENRKMFRRSVFPLAQRVLRASYGLLHMETTGGQRAVSTIKPAVENAQDAVANTGMLWWSICFVGKWK